MEDLRRAISLLTLTVLVVVWVPAFADTLTGKVVKVADGDTITVLDNTNTHHRIRLQGIDAPEKGQPFGNASRKHLASLVAGKEVTVKWNKRDRYRRIVGFVFVDGHDKPPGGTAQQLPGSARLCCWALSYHSPFRLVVTSRCNNCTKQRTCHRSSPRFGPPSNPQPSPSVTDPR